MLGNGRQRKSYLYVQDCIDAIFVAMERADDRVNIFNLGTDEYCELNDSIALDHRAPRRCAHTRVFRGRSRMDWRQPVHFSRHDTHSVARMDAPTLSIRDAVLRTLDYLQTNPTVLETRP